PPATRRRTGADRLGARRYDLGAGRRALAVGVPDGARLLAGAVGRAGVRAHGRLAVPLAGAWHHVDRRFGPAVAVRQPEVGGARAPRRRRALPSRSPRGRRPL